MQALFSELGKRMPDRWLAQYFLPGLVWVVVGYAAVDPLRIVPRAEQHVRQLHDRPAAIAVVCVLGIGAAVAASVAARAIGYAVRVVWLGQWRGPARWLGKLVVRLRRQRRLKRLAARAESVPEVYLPGRPTWIGDRVRIADARVYAQYGLHLALIWPRLWQLVDADTRTGVQDARERFDRASRLGGWGVAYGALTVLWWPMIGPALVLLGYGAFRGRSAVGLFVDTVETTVDLRHRALAEALGQPVEEGKPLSRKAADAINDQLNKGATPQVQPVAATGAEIAEIQ